MGSMTLLVRDLRFLVVLVFGVAMSSSQFLPQLPRLSNVIENEGFQKGASPLINLWQHSRRLGENFSDEQPKTIFAPFGPIFINLVPQDAPNPLYTTDATLRTSLLLDHMSTKLINPEEITDGEGIIAVSMNGKDVVLKKDPSTGTTTVNGLEVMEVNKLGDGTVIYVIDGVLFRY